MSSELRTRMERGMMRLGAAASCLCALAAPAMAAQSVAVHTSSWSPNPAYLGDFVLSTASSTDNSPPTPALEHTITPHWSYTTIQIYVSGDGTSGTFTPYSGPSGLVWGATNGDNTKSGVDFSGYFPAVGNYIVRVLATVTYHDDTANKDVATNTGDGYLGGTREDIDPQYRPPASTASASPAVQANVAAGQASPAAGGNKGIPIQLTVEIDVNNTPDASDDVVAQGGSIPCQAKIIKGHPQSGVGVTLVAKNTGSGSVSIPSNLTLPQDGSPVSFTMTGVSGSSSVNDVTISIMSGTKKCGPDKNVTVFWFDQGTMVVHQGQPYKLIGGTYGPAGGEAVTLNATAVIEPAGVSTSAPQLNKLKLGIEQNARGNYISTWTLTGHHWFGKYHNGDKSPAAPDTLEGILAGPDSYLVDSKDVSSSPIVSSSSLTSLTSCSSSDSPSMTPGSTLSFTFTDPNDPTKGIIADFTFSGGDIQADFLDWAVIVDTTPELTNDNKIQQRLSESSWILKGIPQSGVPGKPSQPVTDKAVNSGQLFNDYITTTKSQFSSASTAKSMQYTYPN